MATYRFSLSAEGDLEGILAYSIDEWGIEQTARYRDQLLGCCQLIAQQSMLGRSCDDIRPGYLRIQEGRHVLFFKRDAAGVLVVRILSKSIDAYEATLRLAHLCCGDGQVAGWPSSSASSTPTVLARLDSRARTS